MLTYTRAHNHVRGGINALGGSKNIFFFFFFFFSRNYCVCLRSSPSLSQGVWALRFDSFKRDRKISCFWEIIVLSCCNPPHPLMGCGSHRWVQRSAPHQCERRKDSFRWFKNYSNFLIMVAKLFDFGLSVSNIRAKLFDLILLQVYFHQLVSEATL